MREVLQELCEKFAFQTSGRFDLLANDHVPYLALGAADVDGELARCIERGEGVVAVVGRMGSGKSSLIAAVGDGLEEGFLPLRVSVIGVEAGDPAAFARHAITEIRDLPEAQLTRHERQALDCATAERTTRASSRELRAGFEVGYGGVLTAKVVGDIKRFAGEELDRSADPGDALRGLQRLFDLFWKLKRCPVMVIEDTDHWGGMPTVAEAFFDQTARAFASMDAVTVLAVQGDYTQLDGYVRVRDKLTAEVFLPRLPDVEKGLATVIERRMGATGVDAAVDAIFEPGGLELLTQAYVESVADDLAGDLRRTLAVARMALDVALADSVAQIVARGHVEEAMAKTPLAPSSALDPVR